MTLNEYWNLYKEELLKRNISEEDTEILKSAFHAGFTASLLITSSIMGDLIEKLKNESEKFITD